MQIKVNISGAGARKLRQKINTMLVKAVESGANMTMDQKDWASIRKAARARAVKRNVKKS